jgi:hypothetical protein
VCHRPLIGVSESTAAGASSLVSLNGLTSVTAMANSPSIGTAVSLHVSSPAVFDPEFVKLDREPQFTASPGAAPSTVWSPVIDGGRLVGFFRIDPTKLERS